MDQLQCSEIWVSFDCVELVDVCLEVALPLGVLKYFFNDSKTYQTWSHCSVETIKMKLP